MGDPHPLHVAEGELAIGPCHWPARPDAGVASHHHDVQGGQREDVVDHPALGDVSEAQTRSALDLPPERRDDSEEGLYERRLAGTVGTDDAPPVALLDREVDVRQEGAPAVTDGEIVRRKERGHQRGALAAPSAWLSFR